MADIPDDEETLLDGLTITGGMGANNSGVINVKTGYDIDKQSGAGIYLVNASPVLKNVRIENNRATSNTKGGGGIYNLATGTGQSKPRLTGDVKILLNNVLGSGHGGGMYNGTISGGTCAPVLEGVVFDQNQAGGNGGGIFNTAATSASPCTPLITGNTHIRGNSASQGGGVSNEGASEPVFDNVCIEANTAGAGGGGVYIANSYVKFNNTTIAGNKSNAYGGGIFVNNSKGLDLVNVTLSGNYGTNGGGIYMRWSSVVMSNIKIEKNYASDKGGGIWMEHYAPGNTSKVALFIGNGIIRANHADNFGGGIHVLHTTPASGSEQIAYLSLTNVLVAENESQQGGGLALNNTSTSGSSWGIRARLTNVTIAGNTASQGSGLWTVDAHTTDPDANLTEMFVYNSIIWGNTGANNIYDKNGRNTYRNSLVEGLSLTDDSDENMNYDNTPAGLENFDPSSWSVKSPLDSDYKLGADAGALINGGNNDHYEFFYDKTAREIIQNETSIPPDLITLNSTVFNIMASSMVDRLKSSDAVAAQGDLRHTVAVTDPVSSNMTVTVTTTVPPTAPDPTPNTNSRIKNITIDVGAYEKN
jgi:hypothetical protein